MNKLVTFNDDICQVWFTKFVTSKFFPFTLQCHFKMIGEVTLSTELAILPFPLHAVMPCVKIREGHSFTELMISKLFPFALVMLFEGHTKLANISFPRK